jgi:opacity protein-like surface antigen
MIHRDLHRTRKKRIQRSFLMIAMAAVLCFAAGASAQVVPSGHENVQRLWVGAQYSNFSASFPYQSGQRIWGIGGFADFHFRGPVGFVGEASYLHFGGFEGETETSYLGGWRYQFRRVGKIRPYAQELIGVGRMHYPFQIGNKNYFAIVPVGGASYLLNRKFALRAEYQFQFWQNSPNYANEPEHSLKPNGVQIGIAYSIFR